MSFFPKTLTPGSTKILGQNPNQTKEILSDRELTYRTEQCAQELEISPKILAFP
jgi:hypothetical protein